MSVYRVNAYRLYDGFRQNLSSAHHPACILGAIARLFPALNAGTAAILSNATDDDGEGDSHDMIIAAQTCGSALWPNYLALCRTNREPLSRILRLSPHPVALSDLRRNRRLLKRTHALARLLSQEGMDDAFAVPVIDQQLRFSMMLVAGRNLSLRPTIRHLLTQVAADAVARLQSMSAAPAAPAALPPHLKLTSRQMEIAGWLIAGKTDWEIGEILQISAKTVNFHVENIKRAYGVKSRNQFVATIVHHGGLTPAWTPPVAAELSGT